MNTKLYIGIIVIMLLGLVGYLLLQPITDTQSAQFVNDSEPIVEGPITAQGTITCIPKIGTGPQTMECALGLHTAENTYYGLRHLSDHDAQFALVSPDIIVTITGSLVSEMMYGPDGNRYDIQGIIEIDTISEL